MEEYKSIKQLPLSTVMMTHDQISTELSGKQDNINIQGFLSSDGNGNFSQSPLCTFKFIFENGDISSINVPYSVI